MHSWTKKYIHTPASTEYGTKGKISAPLQRETMLLP